MADRNVEGDFQFSLPRLSVADRLISLKLERAPWIDEHMVNISNDNYMDGWMVDGWMDGCMVNISNDNYMDGRMVDGWMDGCMVEISNDNSLE